MLKSVHEFLKYDVTCVPEFLYHDLLWVTRRVEGRYPVIKDRQMSVLLSARLGRDRKQRG